MLVINEKNPTTLYSLYMFQKQYRKQWAYPYRLRAIKDNCLIKETLIRMTGLIICIFAWQQRLKGKALFWNRKYIESVQVTK